MKAKCKQCCSLVLKESRFQEGTWAQEHHSRTQILDLEYNSGGLITKESGERSVTKIVLWCQSLIQDKAKEAECRLSSLRSHGKKYGD